MTTKQISLCAIIFLAFMSILGCHRSEFGKSLPPNVSEVQTWLTTNGGFVKSGTYTMQTTTGVPLTGTLSWNEAKSYNWQGNAYLEIPFTFSGDREITGTGVAARVSFDLVLRRKGDGYEGGVRTTLFSSIQANLTGSIDDITTLQTYQLLDGKEGNIWQSNDDLSNPRAVVRRNLSSQQILTMRANAMQQKGVSGGDTVSRSVTDEVCVTKTSTSYQMYCWYATPQQEANQHATCQSQPITVTYQQCTDTTITPIPSGPGGGGGPSGPPGLPPGGQGGGTTAPVDPDCATAAANNFAAKKLLENGSYAGSATNTSVVQAINSFDNMIQQPSKTNEHSISIGYRVQIDFPTTIPHVTVSTTSINQGTPTGVNTVTRYDNDSIYIVAGIHSHPPGQYPAPSAKDVYHLFNANSDNTNYRYQFIFAADGSRYMISITTPATFASFTSSYSESVSVGANNAWERTSKLGKEFKAAESYFIDKMGMSKHEAYENAHAYILNTFTGTTLSKYNPLTQMFESIRPIRAVSMKKDPVTNLPLRDTVYQVRRGC